MLTRFLHAVLIAASALVGHHKPLVKVIDKVEQSVLRIEGDDNGRQYSCTGFVVAVNRVLTAEHCVGTQMTASDLPATVLKSDVITDLALLEVITPQRPLEFRSKPLHRLEEVNGVGFGMGFTKITVTFQRVMILDYAIADGIAPGLCMYGDFYHGMSGGPVVDRAGRIVGIVQRGSEGFSYGVDTATMLAFLESE